MTHHPKAIIQDLVAIEVAGEVVVQDATGREMARLDALAAQVWRRADGTRSVAEIARLLHEELAVTVDDETVWAALDRLSDCDLVAGRITPPALGRSMSRRGILHVAAGAAGAIGASAVVGGASFAQDRAELASKESSAKENSGKRNAQQEANQKRYNQQESGMKQQEASNKRTAQEGASKRMQEQVNKSRK
jgi:Coenzyme PQQ synthesis protein D (PqqD)